MTPPLNEKQRQLFYSMSAAAEAADTARESAKGSCSSWTAQGAVHTVYRGVVEDPESGLGSGDPDHEHNVAMAAAWNQIMGIALQEAARPVLVEA